LAITQEIIADDQAMISYLLIYCKNSPSEAESIKNIFE